MRIKFSFIVLLIASVLFQGCGIKARIKKADKRYEIGEYYAAGDLYRRIYSGISSKEKPLKAKIAFKQAECYRLTNRKRSEQIYSYAIRYNYSDSIVYLRYAQALQQNGKFDEAIKNYELYLKANPANNVAKNGIEASKLSAEWLKKPNNYVVRKSTDFNVNRSSSFCPAFLGSEGDLVVFTSTRQLNKKTVTKNSAITGQPVNNLFIAKKNAVQKWETPTVLEGEVNSINDDGVCTFSPDGKIMYYTQSPATAIGERGTEILLSNRAGGTWSMPQKIKIFNDSTTSVAHPAISPDGLTLYFVSDAKNGYGGKDIWMGKLENGECKYIENLGPEINTSGDEMFPSVRANGTLYFSSNGLVGFGGLDIFKATLNTEKKWVVENLGAPVNSNADDFGICFQGNSEKGFFTSNRNDSKGYDAIWSFELPELAYIIEGKVLDETGTPIPDATVKIVTNNGINGRVQTKKDGSYKIKIDKDIDCVMLATARGYLNQKNQVSTKGLEGSKTFPVEFKLSSISKPIEIENIFYEFGKWDLTAASETGLQVLVKILNDNQNITIEVSANTDFVGTLESNKLLSEKRAKSVVNYLINAGIKADRLTSVGYGEGNPVTTSSSLAQKYPFLKENDVLNEAFVTKLTTEQQEIVNQINRRTEFRVVKTTYNLY